MADTIIRMPDQAKLLETANLMARMEAELEKIAAHLQLTSELSGEPIDTAITMKSATFGTLEVSADSEAHLADLTDKELGI